MVTAAWRQKRRCHVASALGHHVRPSAHRPRFLSEHLASHRSDEAQHGGNGTSGEHGKELHSLCCPSHFGSSEALLGLSLLRTTSINTAMLVFLVPAKVGPRCHPPRRRLHCRSRARRSWSSRSSLRASACAQTTRRTINTNNSGRVRFGFLQDRRLPQSALCIDVASASVLSSAQPPRDPLCEQKSPRCSSHH